MSSLLYKELEVYLIDIEEHKMNDLKSLKLLHFASRSRKKIGGWRAHSKLHKIRDLFSSETDPGSRLVIATLTF